MAPSACAMLLSDFGAEVIKIEAPGRGDIYRYFQDLPGMPDSEIPYCFLLDGRNKKSVVIDLKQESGQTVAHRLIETADVFLTNCHNSVLEDLDMTWNRLRKVNPRLIFAHGTGYGHTGPEAEKPGYDQVCYWTRSGLVATFTPGRRHIWGRSAAAPATIPPASRSSRPCWPACSSGIAPVSVPTSPPRLLAAGRLGRMPAPSRPSWSERSSTRSVRVNGR